MNWLERARREIPNTPHNGTAKTDVTEVSAVMAVPHRGDSEISIPGDDLAENIREHIEERAAIREHCGGEPRKKAEAEARKALRVYEYRLTDNPNIWLILIAPGCDLSQAEQALKNRFGSDRVLMVREHDFR